MDLSLLWPCDAALGDASAFACHSLADKNNGLQSITMAQIIGPGPTSDRLITTRECTYRLRRAGHVRDCRMHIAAQRAALFAECMTSARQLHSPAPAGDQKRRWSPCCCSASSPMRCLPTALAAAAAAALGSHLQHVGKAACHRVSIHLHSGRTACGCLRLAFKGCLLPRLRIRDLLLPQPHRGIDHFANTR
jgi:hypothetical protein